MVDVDKLIRMIPFVESFVEVAADKVEGIDGLQQLELLPGFELPDVCFGGVEEDALEEVRVIVELHLDEERSAGRVGAVHIDNAVFACGGLGHQFWREVAQFGDGAALLQREEGVEQAGSQVGVLPEDLPEGDIGYRAVIFAICHHV
jgi:hypothetical protein